MSTFVQYDGADGDNGLFTVPFVYLSTTHVKVYVNGFPQIEGVHYVWEGASSIRFTPWAVPIAGALVEIRRETPLSGPLATFQNGAVLTEADLNTATRQNFYLIQELSDKLGLYLEGGLSRLANGNFTNAQEMIDAITQEVLSSALLAELQSRIADIDFNAESIIQQTVRVNNLEALVNSLANINGTGISTFILNEQQERIEGDQALASDLALIGAKSPDGLAWVLDLDTVKVNPTESLATRLSSLAATDAANAAAITAEQTARISGDDALASDISALGATVTSNFNTLSAAISNEQTARANGDSANATAITNLAATVTSNYNTLNAAISNEASVRASADSAQASSISTLQTTVNGHTSAISQHASSINGLSAQYTVKVDNNGHVAGFGLASTPINGTPVSEFIVLANKFAIVDPSNSANVKVPFAVSGGTVFMQNVVIGDGVIESLTVGKLTSGVLNATIVQNADINVGTGRIIWSNGAVMLVGGVGFGSSNQFILWFGPTMPVSSCSEATATFYLKTNGSSYFGGSLHAGTLTNAKTTTDTNVGAEIIIGPYGTNGNTKTITVGYTFVRSGSREGLQSYSGTLNATVNLYQKIGAGAETLVASQVFNGSMVQFEYDPDPVLEDTRFQMSMGGSFTYTDNIAGTADRTYRAVVSTRDEYSVTGSSSSPDFRQQRLTLTSVEQ